MIRKYIYSPSKKWFKKKIKNIVIEVDQEKAPHLEKYAIKDELFIHYFPYLPNSKNFIILKEKENVELCEQGLPVPPEELWLGYGKDMKEYLHWGKVQSGIMVRLVKESDVVMDSLKRILEFGCGAGRMIRWLKPYSAKCEIWGTDISSEHIYWANKYLKPHFNFATTTTLPHLPFEDGYFDLIYAGSVFTHIDDLTDSWLLELRRILSKDGRIFITIHDKHTIEIIDSLKVWKESKISLLLKENEDWKKNLEKFGMYVTLRGPASQVFYDIDYFCESVSNIFDVISVTPEAYGYQTGVLLKRKH